jgi:hypothetical protein
MRTLFASTTVLLTILLSLMFGIACGYAVIIAILRAFGYKSLQHATAPATAVIATTASGH